MIQIDDSQIEAEVYHKTASGIYLVKVFLPGTGMYINSITVQTSLRYPEAGLWVQMPRCNWGKKVIHHIEFKGDSKLKELMEDAILRAVDLYQHEENIVEDI